MTNLRQVEDTSRRAQQIPADPNRSQQIHAEPNRGTKEVFKGVLWLSLDASLLLLPTAWRVIKVFSPLP
jgi:hypothetical protein